MSIFHHYDLAYTQVFIFDDFLVSQIRQGVTITPAHNDKLKEIINVHFTNKSLVYISNRCFSYAVDPLTYVETSKIHNLLGIAIVSKKKIALNNALLEKNFYEKPFEIFETISEAIDWVQNIIIAQENLKKK